MAVVQRRVAGLQLDGSRIVLLREAWVLVIAESTSGNLNGAPQALFLRAAGSAQSTAPGAFVGLLSRADRRCRPPDYRSDLRQHPRSVGRGGTSALSRRRSPQVPAPCMRFPQPRWCTTRLLLDSPTREHSGRTVVITPNALRAHLQIDSKEPSCYTRCHRI